MIKDDIQAFLIKGANLTENYEFPILKPCHEMPESLIAFSKTKQVNDFNSYIHFYERDRNILPFSKNPRIYFPRLSQFKGVIGYDISVYRNMPLGMQIGQTYDNRALTFWLQNNGLSVIPNIRYGDERSYLFCFEGIPQKSIISIGTYGCIKKKDDIEYHIKGVTETIKQLKPEAIIFYGTLREEIESILHFENIYYKIFKSYTSEIFNNRKDKSCPLFEGLVA